MAVFDASAVLLKKNIAEDRWDKSTVRISSVDDIHKAVGGSATQVDLDKYHKVYYDASGFASSGVLVHVRDCQSNIQFLPSPILLVLCDDEKPIDLDDVAYGDFFDGLELC